MSSSVTNRTPLNIASFNCRGLNNSFSDVIKLCDAHDTVCVQETWLFSHDLRINYQQFTKTSYISS